MITHSHAFVCVHWHAWSEMTFFDFFLLEVALFVFKNFLEKLEKGAL